MNRRNALKNTAVSIGALGSLPYLTTLLQGCGPRKEDYVPVNLTPAQYATVWHVAETILPKTTTPGAGDAGVAPYIDQLFSGFLAEEPMAKLLRKLTQFMEGCQEVHQKSFDALTVEAQTAYLKDQQEDEESFYHAIRGVVLWGYYTSQVGMQQMNYQSVPGKYDGCISVDETTRNLMGNRW